MQIVIDIPDDLYDMTHIPNNDAYVIRMAGFICSAIANGTPLPKGHGRLIDADELKKHKYHDSNRHEKAVSVAQIDWQPTIIKADKK